LGGREGKGKLLMCNTSERALLAQAVFTKKEGKGGEGTTKCNKRH